MIVPISPTRTDYEIKKDLLFCEISFVVTDNINAKRVQRLCEQCNWSIIIYNIESSDFFFNTIDTKRTAKKKNAKNLKNEYQDAVIVLPTSGSSCYPKKVVHSNFSMVYNALAHANAIGLKPGDRSLLCLPMTFIACNTSVLLANCILGNDIYIYKNIFTATDFSFFVNKHKITIATLVPTQLTMICNTIKEKTTMHTLKSICYSGSFLPINTLNKLILHFPNLNFINMYGQTETGPRLTANLHNKVNEKLGSVGLPVKGVEIAITDDCQNFLPKGTTGNIIAKTPSLMLGYYKNRALTKETITNGWIKTGDIGYLDEDGYLYITGRKKNVIISGGINIYPEEIEETIVLYHQIEDALVYSLPNPLLGEILCAKIVLKKNSSFNKQDFMNFCEMHISKNKIPQKFIIVDTIETNANGKKRREYRYE